MILSLKDGQMTISIEFVATDEKPITVEDVLIGAYNIISREYSQEEVIKAYYRTDPDTMDLRPEVEYPDYVKKILKRGKLGVLYYLRSCIYLKLILLIKRKRRMHLRIGTRDLDTAIRQIGTRPP